MDSPSIEVRDTKLGKAIFATSAFAAESTVGLISGQYIRDPEYGSDYCIQIDDELSIEPNEPFRFLNHSCEPNCELVVWEYEDSSEIDLALQTIRAIVDGEELTIDYGWSADVAIHCLCGSSKCRGWIVTPNELDQLKKNVRAVG